MNAVSLFPRTRIQPLLCLLAMLFGAGNASAGLEQLRWYSEEYAPINFSGEDGIASGISIELLEAMMVHLDTPFSRSQVQILPWARGYRIAQEQPGACLFATTVTDTRREVFKFVEPAVEVGISIIAPKAAALQIDSMDALSSLQIGVVREDIGEQLLQETGLELRLVRTDSARGLMRMLAGGRFDAISYNDAVTFWTMREEDIDPNDFEIIHVLSRGVMGYACHRDTDPALLARLQQALDQLIADGTAANIQQRYIRH